MTLRTTEHDGPAGRTSPHPLQSLTADDVTRAKEILVADGVFGEFTRVAYMGLEEPAKGDVLGLSAGDSLDRRIRVMTIDVSTHLSYDAVVSVTTGAVVSKAAIDGSAGRAPIVASEYEHVEQIVSGDQRWIDALARRGLTTGQVRVIALSAGDFGLPGENGRRTVRVKPFLRETEVVNAWAHPVNGLCAYFDVDAGEIYELIDTGVVPIPMANGDYDDPEVAGPELTGLKPIAITQPDGPSFTVNGEEVSWANWKLRVGYDHREGLILRNITYNDFGTERPVLYRASISEMVVNYGDPSPTTFWVNYFDVGEFVLGKLANSLELGCDCVGDIYYFDAELSDELGNPRTIKNAVCMHEEDAGILWKHSDYKQEKRSSRRNRRLVISFFTTVGNYDYGFYWYLYLDGTIECEAKLTGILFQTGYPDEGSDFHTKLAPNLGAPYHQHLFCARLDVMVDGTSNAVDEVDARRVPAGPGNPWGNAFSTRTTRLTTEQEAARVGDSAFGRKWHIVSTDKANAAGSPTGYMLLPEAGPTLMADPEAAITRRATFATKHLWVTRYDPGHRYPAGEYVNQNPGGDGLPRYIEGDRDINGQDIVVWHVFGPTHFPRIEDHPVMPVDISRMILKPWGFFDRNPALNVPPDSNGDHCHR